MTEQEVQAYRERLDAYMQALVAGCGGDLIDFDRLARKAVQFIDLVDKIVDKAKS